MKHWTIVSAPPDERWYEIPLSLWAVIGVWILLEVAGFTELTGLSGLVYALLVGLAYAWGQTGTAKRWTRHLREQGVIVKQHEKR